MRAITHGLLVLVLVLGAGLAACDSDPTTAAGPPARLEVVSGHDQQGTVGQELPQPLVVQVTDETGRPVQGAQVRWSTAAGTLTGAANGISVTDAQGRASARWTLGTEAGTRLAQAEVQGPGLVVGFTARATPGPPVRVSATPADLSTVSAGEVVNVRVIVADAHGNPVPGITVNVTATHGSVDPVWVTDATGFAWLYWTVPTSVGPTGRLEARLTVSTPGVVETAQTRVTVQHGPAAAVVIIPDVQTAAPDQEKVFTAYLADAYGNSFNARGYGGCLVTWSAPPPAALSPRVAIFYPQLAIRSSSSVTVTATCGGATDTAELVIQ